MNAECVGEREPAGELAELEFEVLRSLANGATRTMIASRLHLDVAAVDACAARARRTLGVSTNVAAVAVLVREEVRLRRLVASRAEAAGQSRSALAALA